MSIWLIVAFDGKTYAGTTASVARMRRFALPALAVAALVLLAGCNVGPGGDGNVTVPAVTPADVPTDTPAEEPPNTPVADREGVAILENRGADRYDVEVYTLAPSVERVNVRYRNGTRATRVVPNDTVASVIGNVSLVTPNRSLDSGAYALDAGQTLPVRLGPPLDDYAVFYAIYAEGYHEGETPVRYGIARCADGTTLRRASVAITDENVDANVTCEPASS
ncbi:hypothetical protein ACFQPA_09675 [Halomarina halobia]|uniref:Lipoprotein n=1 Tax=Halomarina halobia TaxID=3033386 RepID=A0ABD6AC83_9EURY|nr:hypothetical protein [Halomarina sp. PSR21]